MLYPDEGPFVLWLAVPKRDVELYQSQGHVPLHGVSGGRSYIGLREQPTAAVERVYESTGKAATKDSHMLLELRLTMFGLGHFATQKTADFNTVLFEKTFNDDVDWGVWHFVGDIPLSGPARGHPRGPVCTKDVNSSSFGTREEVLMETEWHAIVLGPTGWPCTT
jgi:hypothetical protein